MSKYAITSGTIAAPVKTVLYGPEGIGKSTFAAQFPAPVFIDTEGGTKRLNVARLPAPTSWAMLLDEVAEVSRGNVPCGTLVIDTADWAERLCIDAVCARAKVKGIEDFGYGKGYTYAKEEFGKLLDALEEVLNTGHNVVVLGVTATPDRGDLRNLGEVFDSLAYEYKLTDAIRDGFLCRIMAQTIPLRLDISTVGMSGGDYAVGELGSALDPYLNQIAAEMAHYCKGRKTVVFLPLIKTSQKFRDTLNRHGFHAAEVNGQSTDRAQVLADFDAGTYNVLCNSMLLTEGWDCPSVDCVVVLRPTKVRSLYSQMVGRGTRLHEGKKDLLLLDFLWLTDRHELCRPADLVCEDHAVAQQMTDNLAAAACPEDVEEAARQAAEDVVAQREEALAKQLEEQRRKRARLVDPLQYEMSIQAEDLAGYVPAFGWEAGPPSAEQTAALEKQGICPDAVESAGKASLLLDRLSKRRDEGLTTHKQIRCLEKYGFQHVGTWSFNAAKHMIDRIAACGWRGTPKGVDPKTYMPSAETTPIFDFGW